MKLIKSLAIVGVITALFASCTEEYKPYQPAEPETGSQFFFSKDLKTSITLTPTTTAIEVEVCRGNAAEAATAVIKATDTTKVIVAAVDTTINVAFAAEAKSAVLSIPVKMDKINFGDKFYIDIKITEEATQYGLSEATLTVELPEPWVSLGKAKYLDTWCWGIEDYVELTLEQNQLYPDQFRLALGDEWSAALAAMGGETSAGLSKYINFKVYKAGDTLNGVTMVNDGLVYFGTFDSGYYYADHDADILAVHPASFTGGWGADPMDTDESYWVNSKVTSFQENGLPATIELAPCYYMNGVGGWKKWNTVTQYIVFPGVVLKDYSVALEYVGSLTGKDGSTSALVDVELGEDVAAAQAVVVAGDNPNDGIYAILLAEEGDESIVTFDKSGSISVPFPEELSEEYTVVVITYDEEGEPQEAEYETFAYKDFGIKLNVANPEANPDKITGTVTVGAQLGEDVEFALVTVVPNSATAQNDAYALLEAQVKADALAAGVVKVKDGGEVTFDLPQSGKYLVMGVSVALDTVWNVAGKVVELVTLPVLLNEDFESFTGAGWSVIDADGDGYCWQYTNGGTLNAHSGTGILFSQSYISGVGALTPDNWVFTPAVTLTQDNYLSYWIAAQDQSYYLEHYGVYVTDGDVDDANFDLATCVKLVEEDCHKAEDKFYRTIVAIPEEFKGKTVRIGFRHFDCSDWFYLNLDDIMITEGDPTPAPTAVPVIRGFRSSSYEGLTREGKSEAKQLVSVAKGRMSAKVGMSKSVDFERL